MGAIFKTDNNAGFAVEWTGQRQLFSLSLSAEVKGFLRESRDICDLHSLCLPILAALM
jgi:hypothetical protein